MWVHWVGVVQKGTGQDSKVMCPVTTARWRESPSDVDLMILWRFIVFVTQYVSATPDYSSPSTC